MTDMPKVRPHGAGFLRQRGKSWELRWYVDGEKRYATVRGSKRDAERALRERIREAERGEALRRDASSLSVGDLLQLKLERDKKRQIASLPAVESRMRRLIPAFSAIPTTKLRRRHIEEYAERRLHDAEPATVNRDLELIRAALKLAAEEDPPLINRVPKVEMLPVDNARSGFLDATDYERLRDACAEPWMRLLFVIAYHTGARPGAILTATWDRVDWSQMAVRPPSGTPRNKKVGSWPIYGDFERELRKAAIERERLWPGVATIIHREDQWSPDRQYDSIIRRYRIISPKQLRCIGQRVEAYLKGEDSEEYPIQ